MFLCSIAIYQKISPPNNNKRPSPLCQEFFEHFLSFLTSGLCIYCALPGSLFCLLLLFPLHRASISARLFLPCCSILLFLCLFPVLSKIILTWFPLLFLTLYHCISVILNNDRHIVRVESQRSECCPFKCNSHTCCH